jgi:hypothetical protein
MQRRELVNPKERSRIVEKSDPGKYRAVGTVDDSASELDTVKALYTIQKGVGRN